MLGPVMMKLQAQRRAGLDHDAFDVEPLAGIHAVIPAPRPRNLAMLIRLGRM
ncbi:hypothetical protein D3C71_2196750 [compost metagenome]